MSEFIICKQKFLDKEALVDALIDVGVCKEKISLYDKPILLEGYRGIKGGQTGTIIIHRKVLGNNCDIGFTETAEGFVPQICKMDAGKSIARKITGGDLVQAYGQAKVLREVKKKLEWSVKGLTKLANGRLQIKIGLK